jgi:hypothetical protein
MQITLSAHAPKVDDPRDPQPRLVGLIHLDVYQIDVPLGAVSANEQLWKRVDENAVGVGAGTAELLYKNGVRAGVVPRTEWSFFHDLMQRQPGTLRHAVVNGSHADMAPLALEGPADKAIEHEDIFVFDADNRLSGRTFDQCFNGVSLSFQPAPRAPGTVRVAVCPTIRGERRRIDFSATNTEYDSPFSEVTRFYDLNLRADVPDDSFLIVAPSDDSRRRSSVGGRFFIVQDNAERLERVLVIVPAFLRPDGKPITYTETAAGH